jgi:hypothetical protein
MQDTIRLLSTAGKKQCAEYSVLAHIKPHWHIDAMSCRERLSNHLRENLLRVEIINFLGTTARGIPPPGCSDSRQIGVWAGVIEHLGEALIGLVQAAGSTPR